METHIKITESIKNTVINLKIFIITLIKDIYHQIIENKLNCLFLFLFVLTPIVYELLTIFINKSAYDEYLRVSKNYHVLDEFLTIFAQKTLGTTNSLIGIGAAYFYTYGFLTISATAYLVLLTLIIREKKYRQREPYIYIALTVIMFTIDMSGYWFFPTAPPIRVFPELHYRISIVPMGDSLISIKYNALPSGHIWALTVPYIAAKAEKLHYWELFFRSALILTSWVVILTGDHYILDAFLSYFLCIIFYSLIATIHDYRYNRSKLAPKNILYKRYSSLIILLTGLVLIGIVTLTFINDFIFIIQILCVIIIWPLIVIKTNMNGLLDTDNQIRRSSIQDYKDFFIRIRNNYNNSNRISTE